MGKHRTTCQCRDCDNKRGRFWFFWWGIILTYFFTSLSMLILNGD